MPETESVKTEITEFPSIDVEVSGPGDDPIAVSIPGTPSVALIIPAPVYIWMFAVLVIIMFTAGELLYKSAPLESNACLLDNAARAAQAKSTEAQFEMNTQTQKSMISVSIAAIKNCQDHGNIPSFQNGNVICSPLPLAPVTKK